MVRPCELAQGSTFKQAHAQPMIPGFPPGIKRPFERRGARRVRRRRGAIRSPGSPPRGYHSIVTAAVVIPAPTEQRISLSPRARVSWTSAMARGMLALEVLPTRSTFM